MKARLMTSMLGLSLLALVATGCGTATGAAVGAGSAALVAATIGWSGQAPAQTKHDTAASAAVPSSPAPEKIDGTVTAIDAKNGMVTLRGNDGQTHSFKGDAATLNGLKVGDKVTLNRRAQNR